MADRPQGWSKEEWAEYQAWRDSLPEDVESDGSRHAVMVGDKGAVTAPPEEEPEPEEEAESDQATETPEEESDGNRDAEDAERGPS